jgi:hypothetical protein
VAPKNMRRKLDDLGLGGVLGTTPGSDASQLALEHGRGSSKITLGITCSRAFSQAGFAVGDGRDEWRPSVAQHFVVRRKGGCSQTGPDRA